MKIKPISDEILQKSFSFHAFKKQTEWKYIIIQKKSWKFILFLHLAYDWCTHESRFIISWRCQSWISLMFLSFIILFFTTSIKTKQQKKKNPARRSEAPGCCCNRMRHYQTVLLSADPPHQAKASPETFGSAET